MTTMITAEDNINSFIAEIKSFGNSANEKNAMSRIILVNRLNAVLNEFFSNKLIKETLDGITLNQRKEIEEYQTKIIEINDVIERNCELDKEKTKIEKDYERLEKKQTYLDLLKEKNEYLKGADGKFAAIENEIINYSGENEGLIKEHIEILSSLNSTLEKEKTNLESSLSKKLLAAIANMEFLMDNRKDVLNILTVTPIESISKLYIVEVSNLVNDYNLHVEKLNSIKVDLEKIKVEHNDILKVFKDHHLENESIYGVLKNREGILKHVENLSKEVAERLKKFDDEIKSLVDKRELLPLFQLEEIKKYE
jgi:hypothetical protein